MDPQRAAFAAGTPLLQIELADRHLQQPRLFRRCVELAVARPTREANRWMSDDLVLAVARSGREDRDDGRAIGLGNDGCSGIRPRGADRDFSQRKTCRFRIPVR